MAPPPVTGGMVSLRSQAPSGSTAVTELSLQFVFRLWEDLTASPSITFSIARVPINGKDANAFVRIRPPAAAGQSPPTPIEGRGKAPAVYTPTAAPTRIPKQFVEWIVPLETNAGFGSLSVSVEFTRQGESKSVQTTFDPFTVGTPKVAMNKPTPVPKVMKDLVGAPRLSVALNSTPVTDPGNTGADPRASTAGVLTVLNHVFDRLAHNFEAAWRAVDATNDPFRDTKKPISQLTLTDFDALATTDAKVALAHEAWARQITELLTMTPYAGPGVHYFGDGKFDPDLLVTGLSAGATDPHHGLVHACQHLATAGTASRGVVFPSAKGTRILLNAGSQSAVTWNSTGGQWMLGPTRPFTGSSGGATLPASLNPDAGYNNASELAKTDTTQNGTHFVFGPGTVFAFANRKVKHSTKQVGKRTVEEEPIPQAPRPKDAKGPAPEQKFVQWGVANPNAAAGAQFLADNTASAHIGFTLRRSTSPAGKDRMQFFDTGGLNAPARGTDVTMLAVDVATGFGLSHSGNYDDPFAFAAQGGDPYRGAGVPPELDAARARTLFNHVLTVLRKARPLGLMRFVLVDRSAKLSMNSIARQDRIANWLVYASPLLRMYTGADWGNFSIARALWSLRMTPWRDVVKPMWLIYIPRGPLARAMLDAPRTENLDALVARARTLITSKNLIKNPVRRAKVVDPNRAWELLKEYTLPIVDATVRLDGTILIESLYKDTGALGKQSILHYLEGPPWSGGDPILRMDKEVNRFGSAGVGAPAYFTGGEPAEPKS